MIHDEMTETLTLTPDQLAYLIRLVSGNTPGRCDELRSLFEKAEKALDGKRLAARRQALVLELANEVMFDLETMPHFCKWVRDLGRLWCPEVDKVVGWQVAHVIQCPAVSEEDYEEVLHEVTCKVVDMIRYGRWAA